MTVQAGQQAPTSLCMKSAVYPNLMRERTSVRPEMMLVCSTFYFLLITVALSNPLAKLRGSQNMACHNISL